MESLDPIIIELIGYGGVAGLVLLAMKVAEIVVKITPTETDNRILREIRRAMRVLALDVPDNPGNPKDPDARA